MDRTAPEVRAWLERDPNIEFYFTLSGQAGSTRSRPGSGSSPVRPSDAAPSPRFYVLITRIRTYIVAWNADANPFVWTATADEILAKVALTQTNVRQLVDNNAK